MSVTVWGILSGILLLAIPIYVIYRFELGMINRFLVSVCRMMLVVAGMGLLIFAAVKLDSIGFDISALLIIVLVSSALVIRKAGLKPVKLLVPVAGGMLLSTLVIGFYVLFFVLGQKNPFAPQLFLPVMGIIAFGMIRANARSLEVYYMGLKNHSQLYYYLLGNGSSHREAIDYLLRRSLQASLV
ncbi:MAG: ABC transporter permease, partial [Prevotellaceae bacterium]|nr:ABC transporter permease [Prevotellaceae bacterium]